MARLDRSRDLLGGLSPSEFLHQYWQKAPLFIKQAMPALHQRFSLTPESLMQLSTRNKVLSRLVIQKGARKWQLESGPFHREDFSHLPDKRWTLLVQETEHWLPEMEELRECFRFIPDWRIDDVMISYATPLGGVGPHLDEYDVFLLQGKGTRRWQIESRPRDPLEEDFIPGLDLKILKTFRPDREFICGPGDMLYLPPRVPHHGTATAADDDCMTISIGFRAPSVMELFSHHLEGLLTAFKESHRYSDPELRLQAHAAEISPHAIAKVEDLLRSLPLEREKVRSWFGQLVTAPKRQDQANARKGRGGPALLAWNKNPDHLLFRRGSSRLAFTRAPGQILFFANGQEYAVKAAWATFIELLTDKGPLSYGDLRTHLRGREKRLFLAGLLDHGIFKWQKRGKGHV